jgi:hypothetical protein
VFGDRLDVQVVIRSLRFDRQSHDKMLIIHGSPSHYASEEFGLYRKAKLNILSRDRVTIHGVWIVTEYMEHLCTQLLTTSNCSAIANSHSEIHYSAELSLLSLLCLHQFSRNGFQRRTLPFLWVPERSRASAYQLFTATAHKN